VKEREEVIKRIICLLCYTDRCILERPVIDGIQRSLKEREDQRKIISEWLKWKGYYSNLTAKEKQIMETPVTGIMNSAVLSNYRDYECIEPLLWSVGLRGRLAGYGNYVLADLHPPIQIGPDHSLKNVANSCKDVPVSEIEKKSTIAMLWYWRCLEERHPNTKNIDFKEAVTKTFGESYASLLKSYSGFDNNKCDFVVNGKKVSELNSMEKARLEDLSERRFYAFEWLFSEETWDNVDLIC